MPTDHAVLAPSAAKRWMTCTPSARLEEQIPSEDTAYTREGTIAHAMAETMLRVYLAKNATAVNTEDSDYEYFGEDLKTLAIQAQAEGYEAMEMLKTVHEDYVRIVYEDYLTAKSMDPDAILLVEQRLKLTDYIPEGFGSSDAILIYKDVCQVYDLKYGKGVKVEADHNPQMMCYGIGAVCGPCELYDINYVMMTIIQPRLHHVSTYQTTVGELTAWALGNLKPAAEKAFQGIGPFIPGEHCGFCRAAARCKALKLHAMVEAQMHGQPELMTDDEIAEALAGLDTIKRYVKSIEEYTLAQALQGTKYPGFKLVEGRSLRVIKDQDTAMKKLADAGFEEDMYCKPKELKTITELEKLLRKKGFQELLGSFVVKPQGKPTLVPEDDPRPEFQKAEEDFKDIQL